MNLSYVKLDAKERLIKNILKCFLFSALPYMAIILLAAANYYLYFFLKKLDFSLLPSVSSYESIIKPAILTLSIMLSYLVFNIMKLLSDCFFYMKSRNCDAGFTALLKKLSPRLAFSYTTVMLLKFFLWLAWSALYLSPCSVVTLSAAYCLRKGEYTNTTLLILAVSSLILFAMGISFLYVTLKRYSMCNAVIFSGEQKDSLKIIEKSIEIMDGQMIRYAFYCLSFAGWVLSCLLIIPAVYVLPYKKMSSYSFYNSLTRVKKAKQRNEKPIVFYIPKRIAE